jgi:hypothetical protein
MPKSGEQETDSADARGSQHGDDRLGHVGKKPHHAIPGRDPQRAQGLGDTRHLVVKLRIGDLHGRLPFPLEDQGRLAVPVAQEVFGEIQMCF